MAVGAVSAVPVLAPNLLHVLMKGELTEEREGKRYLMAVGAIAAVPVLAPNLLHVVETLTPVWHALARIMRPRLLREKENQIIFVISRQNF
jgi:hypothetical protein